MKKPKVDKPKHPSELNGDHFTTPGGKDIYDIVFEMHGRLSAVVATVKVGGTIVFLMLAAILAKLFGAIPD